MAASPNFIGSDDCGAVNLTSSLQDIVTGNANSSFVILSVVNTGSSIRTLTIADEDDNTIGVIPIPANAGNTLTELTFVPLVQLTLSKELGGLKNDAFGNAGLMLEGASSKIRAKQDAGTDLILHFTSLNYGASAPRFYATFQRDRLALTTSYQDVCAGGASGSVVDTLYVINTGANERAIRIADENDDLMGSIPVPANAGIAIGKPGIDILQFVSRMEYDGYGNLGVRLKDATKEIRAKQEVGTDLVLYWGKSNY